jgi:hypothetical protein
MAWHLVKYRDNFSFSCNTPTSAALKFTFRFVLCGLLQVLSLFPLNDMHVAGVAQHCSAIK